MEPELKVTSLQWRLMWFAVRLAVLGLAAWGLTSVGVPAGWIIGGAVSIMLFFIVRLIIALSYDQRARRHNAQVYLRQAEQARLEAFVFERLPQLEYGDVAVMTALDRPVDSKFFRGTYLTFALNNGSAALRDAAKAAETAFMLVTEYRDKAPLVKGMVAAWRASQTAEEEAEGSDLERASLQLAKTRFNLLLQLVELLRRLEPDNRQRFELELKFELATIKQAFTAALSSYVRLGVKAAATDHAQFKAMRELRALDLGITWPADAAAGYNRCVTRWLSGSGLPARAEFNINPAHNVTPPLLLEWSLRAVLEGDRTLAQIVLGHINAYRSADVPSLIPGLLILAVGMVAFGYDLDACRLRTIL